MVIPLILNYFVHPPKPFLLEGGNDDVVKDNMELSHKFYCNDDVYNNPLQDLIEEACRTMYIIFGMSLIMHMFSYFIVAIILWIF
jgi:hypothetical protein